MSLLARVDALESQSGKMGDGLMQLTVYTWSMRTKQQLNLCGPGIVMGRVEFAEATKFEALLLMLEGGEPKWRYYARSILGTGSSRMKEKLSP